MGRKEYKKSLGKVEKGNFRFTLEIDKSIFETLEPSEVPEFNQRQEWEEQLTTKGYIQKIISELVLDKFGDIMGHLLIMRLLQQEIVSWVSLSETIHSCQWVKVMETS